MNWQYLLRELLVEGQANLTVSSSGRYNARVTLKQILWATLSRAVYKRTPLISPTLVFKTADRSSTTVTQLVLPTRVELVYRPYQDRVLTVRLRKYVVAPAGLEPNASGD